MDDEHEHEPYNGEAVRREDMTDEQQQMMDAITHDKTSRQKHWLQLAGLIAYLGEGKGYTDECSMILHLMSQEAQMTQAEWDDAVETHNTVVAVLRPERINWDAAMGELS